MQNHDCCSQGGALVVHAISIIMRQVGRVSASDQGVAQEHSRLLTTPLLHDECNTCAVIASHYPGYDLVPAGRAPG